jgi:hypothetical protein
MGIKTEDFVKNLPQKEITEGVDWIRILDEFNPKDLEPKFINECARRNPYYTSYRWEQEGLPPLPVDDRLKHRRKNSTNWSLRSGSRMAAILSFAG